MILIEARRVLVAAEIEPFDPAPCLVEIAALRRDRQDRVHALERREAEHARQRDAAARTENAVEVGDDRAWRSRLERKDAERHAAEIIDVEGANELGCGREILSGARDDEEIARGIDLNERAFRQQRLDRPLQLGG